MKIITLTKKNLLSIFCCFLISVFAIIILSSTAGKVVETAGEERKIPIYCVDTKEKVCSISFDAAWGNEYTDTLLEILEKYDVKTTFFLVEEWVSKYPDSVKKIYDSGHDVGNHSSTHPHMNDLSKEQQQEEIENCNESIEKITGKSPTLFRAPYGEYNNSLVECCNDLCSMYCVQWNIDSLDWKDPTPQEMLTRIQKNLKEGSIILMHNGAKNTPDALPLIIEYIKSEGYEIVPISKLLPDGEYTTDHEGKMICK